MQQAFINPLWPGDVIIVSDILVQASACHLFNKPVMTYCQLYHLESVSIKFYSKAKNNSIQKISLEIAICKMSAIMLKPHYVNIQSSLVLHAQTCASYHTCLSP